MNLLPRFASALLALAPVLCYADREIEVRAVLNDPINAGAEFSIQTAPGVFNKLNLVTDKLSDSAKTVIGEQLFLHGPQGSDPKVAPPLVSSAPVPAAAKRVLVVIAPEVPGGKLPYRMIIVDDTATAFPFGESRIVNLTGVPLAMQAGSNKVALPAGKVAALPVVKDVNEFNNAQTNFYARTGETWTPFAERQLQYVGTMRRIFITYVTPGAGAPTVKTISDHEPAKAANP